MYELCQQKREIAKNYKFKKMITLRKMFLIIRIDNQELNYTATKRINKNFGETKQNF